jgi:hypothetical protein
VILSAADVIPAFVLNHLIGQKSHYMTKLDVAWIKNVEGWFTIYCDTRELI